MDKDQKDTSYFEIIYQQILTFKPPGWIFCVLAFIKFLLLLCKFYDIVALIVIQIDNTFIKSLQIPFITIFIAQAALIVVFITFTLLSYNFNFLQNIWGYSILFLQAFGLLYLETTSRCFQTNGWCQGDTKFKLSSITLLLFYSLLVIISRSFYYYPYHDNQITLSMSSGKCILYDYLYLSLLVIFTNNLFSVSFQNQKHLILILTSALIFLNYSKYYIHPFVARIYKIFYEVLFWTSFIIFIVPILRSISSYEKLNQTQAFLYYWAYSVPIILLISYMNHGRYNPKEEWKKLFNPSKDLELKLSDIILLCNQLIFEVEAVKKSDLKQNSAQFKILWNLITFHNQECSEPHCPLVLIQQMKIQRDNQHLQKKRFQKTIESSLEFGRYRLKLRKDQDPNLIPLNVEIANYELGVFHQRQKGLTLYNEYYFRQNISIENKYSVFYLKKKLDEFFSENQNAMKVNSEQILSNFKHSIEISVTMLGQFWYFLSDPKCNLKKLYDLANDLFPMKIGVDKQWKVIRKLKNIESYMLYAKYLVKMFNDKQKGIKIMEQVKNIEKQLKNKEEIDITQDNQTSLSVEEHGVIFLEYSGQNSGVMFNVNSSCQKIFGYNKGELINRKVNDIMPKIISQHHDKILQNYKQNNKPKMMNKDRQVWGKAKDGYLFPLTICIKPIRNYFSQTSEVYAHVKRQLWMKQYAFLFIDKNYDITDVSGSLLGMFPDLFGRVNMKKKVKVTQILPNIQEIIEQVVNQKMNYQHKLTRQFKLSQTENYTEVTYYNIKVQQFSITVAGQVGYLITFNKVLSMHKEDQINQSLLEVQQEKNCNYLPPLQPVSKQSQFHLFVTFDQKGESVSNAFVKFYGGIVNRLKQTKSKFYQSVQQSFENSRILLKKSTDSNTGERKKYGEAIKTKRLQDNGIKEIHEMFEDEGYNAALEENQQCDEYNETIKTAELNSILEQQNSNFGIKMLKIVTLLILVSSTLFCILQYIFIYQNKKSTISTISSIKNINTLSSQTLYLKMFASKFTLYNYPSTQTDKFIQYISQLDVMPQSLALNTQSQVKYSDGTSQNILLLFAINKLTSQAQKLSQKTTPFTAGSELYFVSYNSVNNILVECQLVLNSLIEQFLELKNEGKNINMIFLIVACSTFFLMLVIKNIIVKAVLKKKSQIINIFFQIPRISCSSIQKQCEKFIQRISNDEDQLEMDEMSDEEEKLTSKRQTKQKKRTIMEQEKTEKNFIIVTGIFFLGLLIFHIFAIIYHSSLVPLYQQSFQGSIRVFKTQKQVAKAVNFINSKVINPTFPLMDRSNSTEVIFDQLRLLESSTAKMEQHLFYITKIFNEQFLQKFNAIKYQTLCLNSSSCNTQFAQDQGLNNLYYHYHDYIVNKQIKYQNAVDTNATIVPTTYLTQAIFEKEDTFRDLFKPNWRKLMDIVEDGFTTFLLQSNSVYFAIMLTVCVINFTILIYAWLKFYSNLEQKIKASQYILTFIPIDEVNRNPKIVQFIKESILDKK